MNIYLYQIHNHSMPHIYISAKYNNDVKQEHLIKPNYVIKVEDIVLFEDNIFYCHFDDFIISLLKNEQQNNDFENDRDLLFYNITNIIDSGKIIKYMLAFFKTTISSTMIPSYPNFIKTRHYDSHTGLYSNPSNLSDINYVLSINSY